MDLKPHQRAWLNAHAEYDDSWLLTALAAGFDVHHIDEDKLNNDPDNLLLIERNDHMKIHGLRGFLVKKISKWESYEQKVSKGEYVYNLRLNSGLPWDAVAEKAGYNRSAGAINIAKAYANYHKLEWPVPHHKDCECTWCKSKR